MKHIGILLLLIVGCNFIDLICIDKSVQVIMENIKN